jgi:hypothetical protein
MESTPPASDCAADALEPEGEWNAYLQAISGFMNGAGLEQILGAPRGRLVRLREADLLILPAPRRSATVDDKPRPLGYAGPRVAVGGMEPSASQIELHTRDIACPSSPPDPRCRLKHHRREMTRSEPPRRGDARGAGPDYHDVRVSGHLLHA